MTVSTDHQVIVAGEYDDMYRTIRSPHYWDPEPSVVEMARLLRPRSHVLDVAGGAGRHSLYLAERDYQLTAVDFSPVGVAKIMELAGLIGRQGQIEAMCSNIRDGLPEGPFDGMVFSLMFQYLTRDEAIELMRWGRCHTTPCGLHALTFYLDDGLPQAAEFEGSFVPVDSNEVVDLYLASGWTMQACESHYIGFGAPAFSAVMQRPVA